MQRSEGIDTLRGTAVIGVVVYHYFVLLHLMHLPIFPYIHYFGQFGVALFFMISGYLIYRSFSEGLRRAPFKATLKRYTLHRLFRIVPAYYFNLAVVLMLAATTIDPAYLFSSQMLKQLLAHLGFVSYFVYRDAGFGINGAYWTLNIEMLWYLFIPLLFLLRRSRLKVVVLLSFMNLIYLYAIDQGMFDRMFGWDANDPALAARHYYLSFQLPGQFMFFAAGIILFLYADTRPLSLFSELRIRYALALAALLMFGYLGTTEWMRTSFLWRNLVLLATVVIVFVSVYRIRHPLGGILSWVGEISYSVYLWHMPLLFLFDKTDAVGHLSAAETVLLYTVCLTIISAMSYYFVEKAGFTWRKRFER